MENNSNTETLQICRTCMKELVNKSLFFHLDFRDENTELTIKQKLNDCIPELDLSIISNAVVCYECADIVNSIYKFKNESLQTEMNIHKYIQHMQQSDNVDLVEVAQFKPYENFRTELKTEAFEIIEHFKVDESTFCDNNSYNEEYIERDYFLSLQKVDLENVLFNPDDNFMTFNTSDSECKDISNNHDGNIVQNNILQVVDKQDEYIPNIDTTDIMYQCYICGHKTESKIKLIMHIKSHKAKNLLQKSKRLLRNNKSILCEPIQRISSIANTKINFNNCNYSKLNSKNHSKRICQDSNFRNDFNQDSNSESNVRSLMIKKPFKCLVCEYQCTKKASLKIHMRIHTGEKPFKCSVCEYQCTQKGSLKYHMRIHTSEKPFKCSVCEYQCTTKSNLNLHMRIHTGEKPFKCSVCEYQCTMKSHLKVHMRIHTSERPFQCSVCEYQCIQKVHLKVHMRNHTDEKPFKCAVCEYQCIRKSLLEVHMRIHTSERPFKCSVCEYQCTQSFHLKVHMRIHTGEKPFKCSVCEYQCSRKDSLKIHMRIHTNEKPFKCSVCEYQCTQKINLKRHMRIHTGEKPFKCSVCEYQCSTKSNLEVHMQIHASEKLFKCPSE